MARLKTLADLVEPCLGPALAAHGFAAGDVVVAWPEIVGERLARYCQPVRLERPRRRGGGEAAAHAEPATLVVRVESAFALELQHVAPLVVERINARYGWRCVGRLALKQGRVKGPPLPSPAAPPLDEAARRRIDAALADLGEPSLRTALDRLGTAVLRERAKG